MDNALVVIVPTGTNSEYRFIKKSGIANPYIEVETQTEGSEHPGRHYHTFEGRGATAVQRLVERCAELEKFYRAVEQLAVTDYFSGALSSFVEKDDIDEHEDAEKVEAWETVSQMVEELREREEKGARTVSATIDLRGDH